MFLPDQYLSVESLRQFQVLQELQTMATKKTWKRDECQVLFNTFYYRLDSSSNGRSCKRYEICNNRVQQGVIAQYFLVTEP